MYWLKNKYDNIDTSLAMFHLKMPKLCLYIYIINITESLINT